MAPKNLFSVLFICLLLAGGSAVIANAGQHGQAGGGQPPTLPDSTQIVQIVDEMAKALSLSDEQKDKISDLYFTHFAEAEKIMSQATGDREDQRRKMGSLRDDFEKKVKAELNDEQKVKFEEMAKSRPARPGPPGQQRR